jgi:hypothetical protein
VGKGGADDCIPLKLSLRTGKRSSIAASKKAGCAYKKASHMKGTRGIQNVQETRDGESTTPSKAHKRTMTKAKAEENKRQQVGNLGESRQGAYGLMVIVQGVEERRRVNERC